MFCGSRPYTSGPRIMFLMVKSNPPARCAVSGAATIASDEQTRSVVFIETLTDCRTLTPVLYRKSFDAGELTNVRRNDCCFAHERGCRDHEIVRSNCLPAQGIPNS